MLERASTCLESGGRQLFRAPKRCLRSRRMLHSFFWHHGASDLALPIWWAASPVLDRANGDVDDHEPSRATPAGSQHAPLLEFLYPEKTLALIRRLSAYSSETVDTRRRQISGPSIRQFSTARWLPRDDGGERVEATEAKAETERIVQTTTAADALQDLLRAGTAGKQELAWHLYSATSEQSRTPELQLGLLDYLLGQDISSSASRILQIFDDIPVEHRLASSYETAISAYVALKMVGPAIQLLEEAATRFESLRIGTDVILERTVQDDQWELTLRVFRTFIEHRRRLGHSFSLWAHRKHRETLDLVMARVAQLPELPERLRSFLSHVRQFQHELQATDTSRKTLHWFVAAFIPQVMNQVLSARNLDEDFVYGFFAQLFRDLRSLEMPTSDLYEYAIVTMIDLPRYREYTNRRKIFLGLYRQYREGCLRNPRYRPSRYLISRLIVQHGEKRSTARVNAIVDDLRTFHAADPFTPQSLAYLIRYYARIGDVDHVHEYFDKFLSLCKRHRSRREFKKRLDLRILASLPYAYARRVDTHSAVQQFKRIKKEFGLRPDVGCWNVLLYAFVRADDLDGALKCFNNCLESRVRPDMYTFGPLLDLCANRGDLESFEALFSRAKQLKIPVDNNRHTRTGYVQAFLGADDPESAEAVAHGMLQSWRAGTLRGDSLTHTWNSLIAWYAVKGDLANSRRLYTQMTQNDIPIDTLTYAALMRSLIEAKQTNAAYKILRVTMPANGVQVHAFHYAIVITGFLRERQHTLALSVYNRLEKRRIPQTEASRQSSLLVVGITELLKFREKGIDDPQARLEAVEEKLRQSILANYGSEIAHDQPNHRRYIDSPELSNIPQSYTALVIMLYTTRGAYDICKQLFEAASKSNTGNESYEAPITLLTAIMEAHYKAGEHEEVERCWELAQSEAKRLVKTFRQVMNPQPPTPEFDSITDPTIKEKFESSYIATNRRQILWRASRIYIRSLLKQDTPQALQQAQRTIRNLLTHGFIIDSLTWNEFLQQLAQRGRIIDAFSVCEMYLMPQFPGWRALHSPIIRQDRPGYAWMELRHYDVKRTSVLPRYKTLVVMAACFERVKRDEREGLGFNPDFGGWTREVLEQIAPLTVRAIETMPRTGDPLQVKYLRDL